KEINGKKFYIGHGDGLGPGDVGFKLLKWAFTNKFLQWCFARIHPNFAMWLGYSWSKKSRYAKGIVAEKFAGLDKELTILHSKKILSTETIDYFVYGHRHIPSEIKLNKQSTYYNLGDWIYSFTYCIYDGKSMELKQYEGKGEKIIRLSV
ncbi:MAG: UDP-2,3-diacylglucosamine diphosphatase, partial [Bacteroidales bacterium]|nr:UDP-2,3-diacylglucosamine diphosphatase [Bacteroidales bacterium]